MALTLTAIFKPERVRIPHINDLITIYTGQAEDDFAATTDLSGAETDINDAQVITVDAFKTTHDAQVVTAQGNIDTLFSTFEGLWPFADFAAFQSALATLNTDTDTEITTTILPDIAGLKSDLADDVANEMPSTATVSIVEVLGEVKSDMTTQIAAQYNSGTNYACTRCVAEGRYPANNDPDETVTTPKHCISCDGLTRTKEPLTPTVVSWAIPNDDITL